MATSNELPYVVECKSIFAFFEPIAAFNVDCVAHNYAADCKAANPGYAYRVVHKDCVNG